MDCPKPASNHQKWDDLEFQNKFIIPHLHSNHEVWVHHYIESAQTVPQRHSNFMFLGFWPCELSSIFIDQLNRYKTDSSFLSCIRFILHYQTPLLPYFVSKGWNLVSFFERVKYQSTKFSNVLLCTMISLSKYYCMMELGLLIQALRVSMISIGVINHSFVL